MTAPYNPPVKNENFALKIALGDASIPGSFKANPTIAAGDFKVETWDGGSPGSALGNLITLPSVDPSGSVLVLIQLSAAEMNGDVVTIVGIDQTSPKEWNDFVLSIPTTSS